MLGVWLSLQLLLALLAGRVQSTSGRVLSLGLCEVLVLGGASLVLAYQRPTPGVAGGVKLGRLAVGRTSPSWLLAGLAAGVAVHPVATALREGVERLSPTPGEQLRQKLALLGHEHALDVVVLFLVIGAIGPLFEELFYRGVLYTRVAWARGSAAAGWLSSAGFVFAHGDVRDWPSLFLVSALITWFRARSGSLWAGVLAHAGFNGSTLALFVFAPELVVGGVATGLGALLLIGLLAWAARTTRNAG